ncbi:MAG: aspartyl-phosphate phosphatase Spo0E family protein [Desulfotomaculum sp.]|nr:aspartyl-phosphate phosphatase Spo0E family protein [Desulfotomaculum sp.]
MNTNKKIEIARNILNNAAKMNISGEILLKISQKLDKYIVEYYENGGKRVG